jgi:hypothetical protein
MYLSSLDQFPDTPHWVIMSTESYHVPGDERSRQCPGHGYPAHTITKINYEIYHNEEDWLASIQSREDSSYKREYVAFKSSGKADVTTKVQVEVSL